MIAAIWRGLALMCEELDESDSQAAPAAKRRAAWRRVLLTPVLGLLGAAAVVFLVDRGAALLLGEPVEPPLLFRPGIHQEWDCAEFSYAFDTNDLGMRERAIGAKQPNTFRIVVIGDSFTFGWGVSAEKTWSRQLESLLVARRLDVEILNCGKPGIGPFQYAAIAERYVPLLEPDLVCVGLYQGNDVATASSHAAKRNAGRLVSLAGLIAPHLISRMSAPAFQPSECSMTAEETRRVSRERAKSFLGEFTPEQRARFDALDLPIREAFLEGRLNPFLIRMAILWPQAYEFGALRDAPRKPPLIAAVAESLMRIREAAARQGAEMLALSLPHGSYVNRESWAGAAACGLLVDEAMLDSAVPDEDLREACRIADVPFAVATDAFRQQQERPGLYHPWDSHFTPAGHRLFAEAIAPVVAEAIQACREGDRAGT